MNLKKTLRLFYWVNEYVILHFSYIDSTKNNIVLKREYILDLCKLNNIIGRFELYLNDKKDKENCIYMVEWFKREMNNRDFDYDEFMTWAEEQEAENRKENE